jgi:hypothetical protein
MLTAVIRSLIVAVCFVSVAPLWAEMTCRTVLENSPLIYWNPAFEERLTYKLSAAQIDSMQKVPSVEKYKSWLKRFDELGWTADSLAGQKIPSYIFRAYRDRAISIHQFATGMLFYSARFEIGELKSRNLIAVTELNIDQILAQEILPLKESHRLEFRRRALMLNRNERVILKVTEPWITRDGLTALFWQGDDPRPLISTTGVYPIIPSGTQTTMERDGWEKKLSGSILSVSLRQILTDVMHGEQSVQHVPVIGNENSFDMAPVIEMGGRSLAIPFLGIRVHHPHGINPVRQPLTVILHDYYHNESVARTSLHARTTVIPYLLRFIAGLKGQTFNQLSVPFLANQESGEAADLQIKHVNQQLQFMGIQTAAEDLTDEGRPPWSLEKYLNKLSMAFNYFDPFENKDHGNETYIVLGALLENMQKNPDVWTRLGFGPQWLEKYMKTANYRVRHVYGLVRRGEFASARLILPFK